MPYIGTTHRNQVNTTHWCAVRMVRPKFAEKQRFRDWAAHREKDKLKDPDRMYAASADENNGIQTDKCSYRGTGVEEPITLSRGNWQTQAYLVEIYVCIICIIYSDFSLFSLLLV